ncbi:sulfurtransferase TusA family protein [Isachenkonia alkalipeptolytica]|uniref:Preprotein translocase subunit TatB n=1 Tax=Isachenkonia alkalipeptolytica TaxID=2565777 RepID=A0AA44BE69_9CLOT|nr:sulfurtransferase TusA family protein [Isachenkonia alkalipeptolytica]NBG87855.1 preprotein translocase subunit TatB [Isachenkonia alkalipeptolytica]
MSKNQVDARGRSCPEPVILTKKALDHYNGEVVEVLVDLEVAVENIRRYAENNGFAVSISELSDEDYQLTIKK